MAKIECGLGEAATHLTTRGVAEVANGIQVLPRGTGGDEDSCHGSWVQWVVADEETEIGGWN